MFEAYRVPREYMPFWHFGARMGIGTVRRFYTRMRRGGAVRVLDAGTGGGANTLLGAWMGFRMTAGDLSREALISLRATAGAARPRVQAMCTQADSRAAPFADETFDVVIASHIIEHLAEPALLLRECLRVLSPGGVLRVSCPSRSHGMRVARWIGVPVDPDDHAVEGYTTREIAGMLPGNARIVRVSYQGRFIESNVSDAQFVLARQLGMSGNPAAEDESVSPSAVLFAVKELCTLPLLALAKCEDIVLRFMAGSMVTVEIEKIGG